MKPSEKKIPRIAPVLSDAPLEPAALTITDLGQEGQGIGHIDGLAVFVDGAIPGDRCEIAITSRTARYAFGSVIRLLEPSPSRIEPACAAASSCGGCSLQNMAYPAQLAIKRKQVIDALQRIGHLADAALLVRPILGMADPWHYRSAVQMPVTGSADRPQIGFYQFNSHQVVDTAACSIQPPICDVIRTVLRDHIRQWRIEPYEDTARTGLIRQLVIRLGFFTGDIMVGLSLAGETLPGQTEWIDNLQAAIAQSSSRTEWIGQPQAINDRSSSPTLPAWHLSCAYLSIRDDRKHSAQSPDIRLLFGQSYIEEVILGLRYRISPLAFFQVNPRQTTLLFSTILTFAALTGQETVLDLYCGTGSITLQMARRAAQVIGIEIVGAAIEDARANARLNRLDNVRFLAGKAEDLLPGMLETGLQADVVVVDPPRRGCDRNLIETLIRLAPARLIYVSCNPATLARDISLLQPAGFQVREAQPVDLFPWTGHVETVVLMSRK